MYILCFLVGIVAMIDYRSRRIPNVLLVMILFWSMIYRYLSDSWPGCLESVLRGSLVLVLAYPFFKIGSIGAGDVKLIALCSGFTDWECLLNFLFSSLLIAAMFSIYKMIKNDMTKERLGYLLSYFADVCRSGKWTLYVSDRQEMKRVSICMAGPIFLSLLLHLGGVY